MRVTNINGTSDRNCSCGSWLNHWKNFSGQSLPNVCPEIGCLGRPEVGAHVQRDSATDRAWYIVPLCATHNAQTGKSLEILNMVELVSANVKETCAKSRH